MNKMKQKILIVGDGRSMWERTCDECFKKGLEPSVAKCPFCSHKESCEAYLDLSLQKRI